MGDGGIPLPAPPDFPPSSFADQTPPPPVLSVTTEELDRPTMAFAFPKDTLAQLYRWVYWFHRDLHAPSAHARRSAGHVVDPLMRLPGAIQFLLSVLADFVVALIEPIFKALSASRAALEAHVVPLAVESINELFGGALTAADFPTSTNPSSVLERAYKVGGAFHDQFISKFKGDGDVTPEHGMAAARAFTGQLANFGATTGVLGVLGELIPILHIDQFEQIGAQVGGGLGLGHLHRLVMRPLMTTLLATPYQHWLNKTFHPTEFALSELANPYTGAVMDDAHFYAGMELLGFTTDKADQVRQLHEKKLTEPDIEALMRWGVYDEDAALGLLQKLGYSVVNARLKLSAIQMHRGDTRITALVDSLESNLVLGDIDLTEFLTALNALPITSWERTLITSTAQHKLTVHAKHRHLTLGEWEYAFENGLVDLVELEQGLRGLGYDDNSLTILVQTTLLKTKKLADAAAAKRARQAVAAAKAAAAARATPTPTPGTPGTLPGA